MTGQAESIIREVMASEAYRAAVATLTAEHDRTVEDIVALTQIAGTVVPGGDARATRSRRWPRRTD